MVLNVLPMIGPKIIRAAITTMATRTRIKAYSTKPWPFSFGANNMAFISPFFRILPARELCSLYAVAIGIQAPRPTIMQV
jgi:hypothetical protein